MTPTEEDKKFFVEHQKFFERLWKPRFGDLVLCWDADEAEWGKDLWCVIGQFSEDAVDVIRERDGAIGAALIVDCALLPRQRQLQEMLEERGWAWRLAVDPYAEDDIGERRKSYQVNVARFDAILYSEKSTDDRDFVENIEGPTPAIALGRALIEALKEE